LVPHAPRLRALLIAAALLAVAPAPARAQVQEDNQAWLTAEGRADLTRALRLTVQQELRVGTEAGYDETFTDVELGYRINRRFAVGAHYRLILLDGETRHRVAGDAAVRWRKKPVDLRYRLRLQATTREADSTLVPMRHKFTLGILAPHHLEPYVAVEFHYLLSPVSEYRERRLYAGVEWAATDRLDLEAYFLDQRESNVQLPEHNQVIGLMASWQFRSVGGKGKGKKKGKHEGIEDGDQEAGHAEPGGGVD
jgi:uncharacterized protein DUF2490